MLLKEIVETCFAAQKSVKSLDCDIQIFTREVCMYVLAKAMLQNRICG